MKKIFALAIFLPIFLLLCACSTTKSLWTSYYFDSFDSFVFSEDGSQVIFIGEKYNYVIDDVTGKILAIASWENRGVLYFDTANSRVKVYNDGNITGTIVIKAIFQTSSPEISDYLKRIGFIDNGRDNLYLNLKIQGKRYKPMPNIASYASRLDKRYNLQIEGQNTIIGSAGKVVATPFALILDVFKIILTPFLNW